jgi:hypothetical protein
MKNIILTVILLGIVLVGNAYAVGQNSNPGTANQQTQVDNRGENTQIKNDDMVNSGGQVQQQTQQQLQDGTGDGNQVQNQINNQEETKQVQNDSEIQRRSQVSNAVQEMIQMAERNGGVGEQIRTIAQTQNQNQIKLEESIEKVQKRSNLVKFIAGPDYKEINSAKKILEQNREQIQQINQIKMQLENSADQQVLTKQVQLLEVANLEIENVLNNSQKGFSLLGWMFKLFAN